jgi:transcriptional regulator with XRE-family HTH domain
MSMGVMMKMRTKRNIMERMAMDSPLRRWRRSKDLTQKALADQLGVHMSTVAKYEQRFRVPREDELRELARVTGLSLDAILFPETYLQDHPEFLAEWAEIPPRRGRYPEPRPGGESSE